jgi:hypothetical protein
LCGPAVGSCAALLREPLPPPGRPNVESRRVAEEAADRAVGLRSRARRVAQPPEGQREVRLILRHDVEQILRQLAIALAFLGGAELAPETPVIGAWKRAGKVSITP